MTTAELLPGRGARALGPEERLWDDTPPASSEAGNFTIGTPFSVEVAGVVTGLRYYHLPCASPDHPLSLWAADGSKIAAATDPAPTDFAGWREVALAAPVPLAIGTYVTTFTSLTGAYGTTPGPLPADLAPSLTAGAGVWAFGSDRFPDQASGGLKYDSDVVYQAGTDVEPPPDTGRDLTAIRAEVAAAIAARLAGTGINVADQAVRSIGLPAVVLTPGVPYAQVKPEGPGHGFLAAYVQDAQTVRLVAWVMVGREIDRPLDLLEAIAADVRLAVASIPGSADDGITAAGDVEPLSGVAYIAARIDFRISR